MRIDAAFWVIPTFNVRIACKLSKIFMKLMIFVIQILKIVFSAFYAFDAYSMFAAQTFVGVRSDARSEFISFDIDEVST